MTIRESRPPIYPPTCTTRSQRVRLVDEEAGDMELEIDMDTANAAKTLKEMHERNEIAGRPAGTSFT